MSTFQNPPDKESLDCLTERDERTGSWVRSNLREALIQSFGRFGYKVTLRDGEDVHYCALGLEGEVHRSVPSLCFLTMSGSLKRTAFFTTALTLGTNRATSTT
ncbi:RNA-binding protein [Natrinema salaciae]|uniref:Uncharacterized protein n=1 Tax=Natrinema salaciae TaxID=1186196 RepID=A0A1H9LVZ7_9EURY|nr:hypothetical protein SAMN04489841_3101 [Natrinema salaciae]